jgi:hypothetical protein
MSSIAGGNDPGVFHHDDDGARGAVNDAFGHGESLPWLELDDAILEVDEEDSLEDEMDSGAAIPPA